MSDRPSTSSTHPDYIAETPKIEPSQKSRRRWPWIFAILILLGGALAIFFYRKQPKAEAARGKSNLAPPPIMIATATAQKGDIGVYVSALGVVTPVNTVSVRS